MTTVSTKNNTESTALNDLQKIWTADAVRNILLMWFVVICIFEILLFLVDTPNLVHQAGIVTGLFVVLFCLRLVKQGRIRYAGYLFNAALWIVLTVIIFSNDGLSRLTWVMYVPVVLMIGMFAGAKSSIYTGIVSIVIYVIVSVGTAQGWLRPTTIPDATHLLVMSSVILMLVATITYYIMSAVERTFVLLQARSAELEASEKRFRTMVEYAADAVIISDPETYKILDANQEACRSLGYTLEELLTLSIPDIHPMPPPEDDLTYTPTQTTTSHRRKDGTEFPITVRANLFDIDDQQLAIATIHDLTEQEEAYTRLEASNAEKESLLREVHHRVDNNLQVISSMLRLQQTRIKTMDDVTQANREMQNRVRSMFLVHRQLYQSPSLDRVDIAQYLEQLSAEVGQSYGASTRGIQFVYAMQPVMLKLSTAITVGLMANEIISNALKHAFPENARGIVTLALSASDDTIRFSVCDNGCGFNIAQDNIGSLGVTLLKQLAQQLLGTLEIDSSDQGTTFELTFSDADHT